MSDFEVIDPDVFGGNVAIYARQGLYYLVNAPCGERELHGPLQASQLRGLARLREAMRRDRQDGELIA